MLVDDDPQRAAALEYALRDHGYSVLHRVSASDHLPDHVKELQPDVVLIDVEAPGRDTLEQIQTMSQETPRPVVMFSAEEDQDVIYSAIRAGVSAYITEGVSEAKVRTVIHIAIAQFRQHQALRAEAESAKNSLEDRKLVDRAKGLLMSRHGYSEPEAYRALQKLAMGRHRRLADVAADVLGAADLFADQREGPS